MALALRKKGTSEILLFAGGVWDRREHRYTKDRPKKIVVVDVVPSQVEFVSWFAGYLRDLREGRPRAVSLAGALGDRRGGKTVVGTLCTVALMIDCPSFGGSSSIGWLVSVAYPERDELDRIISEKIPREWYIPKQAPEYRYYFANGAMLRNVSANNPDTLKRGRVDCLFYNEAQKLPVSALVNGIMGTADKGGITILAANPPRKKKGEWVRRLKEAVEEERIGGIKLFALWSKDNPEVDQPARKQTGAIVRLLDPRGGQADDEGLWLPVDDKAYPYFNGKRNIGIAPVDEFDVTPTLIKRKAHRQFKFFAGADFQRNPYNCVVGLRAFMPLEEPIYVAEAEFLKDGSEDYLIDDLHVDPDTGRGYAPEELILIGDASGTWQDSSHQQGSAREGQKGRVSFDFFKQRRWTIVPPRMKKSERGEHPRNPDVDDRLNLVNKLLAKGRLIVDPDKCPQLTEALRECELAPNGKPRGRYSHITDALGYALWWIEPQPKPYRAAPTKEGTQIIPFRPRGPRMF